MENEPEIKVKLAPLQISVGETTNITPITAKAEEPKVIPAVPIHAIKDNGDIDPPDEQEVVAQIRKLASKSALVALEKLMKRLESLKDDEDIEKIANLALKILDAQMAFDWSDRYARAILKNPSLLKNIKGGGGRTSVAQGNMTKLNKLNQGDGRTTPKKLKNDMPKDEEEAV